MIPPDVQRYDSRAADTLGSYRSCISIDLIPSQKHITLLTTLWSVDSFNWFCDWCVDKNKGAHLTRIGYWSRWNGPTAWEGIISLCWWKCQICGSVKAQRENSPHLSKLRFPPKSWILLCIALLCSKTGLNSKLLLAKNGVAQYFNENNDSLVWWSPIKAEIIQKLTAPVNEKIHKVSSIICACHWYSKRPQIGKSMFWAVK